MYCGDADINNLRQHCKLAALVSQLGCTQNNQISSCTFSDVTIFSLAAHLKTESIICSFVTISDNKWGIQEQNIEFALTGELILKNIVEDDGISKELNTRLQELRKNIQEDTNSYTFDNAVSQSAALNFNILCEIRDRVLSRFLAEGIVKQCFVRKYDGGFVFDRDTSECVLSYRGNNLELESQFVNALVVCCSLGSCELVKELFPDEFKDLISRSCIKNSFVNVGENLCICFANVKRLCVFVICDVDQSTDCLRCITEQTIPIIESDYYSLLYTFNASKETQGMTREYEKIH